MYPVACAIYRGYYMQHISAAPRSAKCISQARCIEMHRDACNRKTQRHHACTSLRLSIHFHIFIFVSIFLSIPPSSLYIHLFLFKRHDNPHGNSEILASWRSALDTFRELASALIEALGLVENLINVRRTRSVRARSLPPHLLCVRVATASIHDLSSCYLRNTQRVSAVRRNGQGSPISLTWLFLFFDPRHFSIRSFDNILLCLRAFTS